VVRLPALLSSGMFTLLARVVVPVPGEPNLHMCSLTSGLKLCHVSADVRQGPAAREPIGQKGDSEENRNKQAVAADHAFPRRRDGRGIKLEVFQSLSLLLRVDPFPPQGPYDA
jgi:hypothetical protein